MRTGAHSRQSPTLLPNVFTLLLAVSMLLAGCGGNARAPVEDRRMAPSPRPVVQSSQTESTYRVQRNETLYSIAFRYGMDFRKVAAANNIRAPYTIYPGQMLVMREMPIAATASRTTRAPLRKPDVPKAVPPARVPATSSSKSPTKPVPKRTDVPTVATSVPQVYTGAPVRTWLWPATGKLTRGYSGSVHKGIDIAGKRGDAVVATAAGKVVYAGAGIVGFGELLIIKHNEIFLSAYGHNDALLVREGQIVAAGEKIAEKGSSGTDSVKLHFEIRKEGKPIDPQRLLPRKR